MQVGNTIRIEGLEDAIKALRELPKKLRAGALLKGLRAAGKVLKADAQSRAPVLATPTKHRIRGLVKRSIVVASSKIARRRGELGVFVTVRRSKAARGQGAFSSLKTRKTVRPNDPFYFKFLEEGWIPRGPGKSLKGGDLRKRVARFRDRAQRRQYSFLGQALPNKGQAATEAFSSHVLRGIAEANARR